MQDNAKEKSCVVCNNLFLKTRPFEKTCGYECAVAYAQEKSKKNKTKNKRKAVKEFRESDKSWLTKIAQQTVNRYVRIRDKNEPCISCLSSPGFRIEAGHYRSSGNNHAIRFNTLNIHAQDHKCNCHMSANLVPYRENLIKKIGLEKVEWLESQTQPRKYSVEYLQKLIRVFRKKIKQMEKRV